MACANNTKQLVLGMHNYMDAHKAFPHGAIGNATVRLWCVALMPFIEQAAPYGELNFATNYYTDPNRSVLYRRFAPFTCPSDTNRRMFAWSGSPSNDNLKFELHNYLACSGNTANTTTGWVTRWPETGDDYVQHKGAIFKSDNTGFWSKLDDISDGTSNTMAVSETIQSRQEVRNDHRGFTVYVYSTLFSTYDPPNTSNADYIIDGSCDLESNPDHPCVLAVQSLQDSRAIYRLAARSRHTGGVNIGVADGSCTFISNTINLDTWRALSSTYSGLSISF